MEQRAHTLPSLGNPQGSTVHSHHGYTHQAETHLQYLEGHLHGVGVPEDGVIWRALWGP